MSLRNRFLPAALAVAFVVCATGLAHAAGYTYQRVSSPSAGTAAYDAATGDWVATFTDGAYTVRLAGPSRTLSESNVSAKVVATYWVRPLPKRFNGTVDEAWLNSVRGSTKPDVIAKAFQYVAGARALYADGIQIAGNANYGPLVNGVREEGSDFNDYLGIPWEYKDGTVDEPEDRQIDSLDCSGFMRMIWGYRSGVPLTIATSGGGTAIPRRAVQIVASGPGVLTIKNTGRQVTDFSKLRIGDLVFFDAATNDGTAIDHVGMYLGKDTAGHQRFISSRKTPNGPTMGDVGGTSILDGTGHYAHSFRAARRL